MTVFYIFPKGVNNFFKSAIIYLTIFQKSRFSHDRLLKKSSLQTLLCHYGHKVNKGFGKPEGLCQK